MQRNNLQLGTIRIVITNLCFKHKHNNYAKELKKYNAQKLYLHKYSNIYQHLNLLYVMPSLPYWAPPLPLPLHHVV